MKQNHCNRFDYFDTDYVEIPSRPDIDRIIVLPLKTVYINLSAEPGANVTRLVHDLNEPLEIWLSRLHP